MAYSIITVKCPNCGTMLSVDDNRTKLFCSYCGASVLVSNENEHIVRHVDDADVIKAETEKLAKIKEIEMQQQREAEKDRTKKLLLRAWIGVTAALLVAFLTTMLVSNGANESATRVLFLTGIAVIGGGAYFIFGYLPKTEQKKAIIEKGGIRFPHELAPFAEKNYRYVQEALSNAGFTNIKCINLRNLNLFSAIFESDKVETISVDGVPITSGGEYYMPDVPIVISYRGR